MSLFGSIQTLNSALQAFTYGQAITSANIANVNTPGYANQVVDLSAGAPENIGGLLIGTGVNATGAANTRNVYLDNQLKLELGQLGYQTALSDGLQQVAALFPEAASSSATNGLQGAIANLSAAWATLATDTAAAAAATKLSGDQNTVLTDMQAVTQMLNSDSQQLYSLQRTTDTQVSDAITQANSLMDQVVTLNKEIQLGTVNPIDGQPNVLVDQREQVAEQLAQLVGATSTITANGTMVVTFNGGTLADGNRAYHLEAIPSTVNQSFVGVGYMQSSNGMPTDVSNMITSGTLGGLLALRDQDIMGARLALDKMAFGIINYANQINESGGGPALFGGTKASDIHVSAVATSVMATRDTTAPGDLATMQAALQSMDMYQEVVTDFAGGGAPLAAAGSPGPIDPNQALNNTAVQIFNRPLAATSGTLTITVGGNAVSVNWTDADTLNSIIQKINQQGGGAIYATFNASTSNPSQQQVEIFSSSPATISDVGGLAYTLGLSSELNSSAPVNNGPIITATNSLQRTQALNSATNLSNIFTQLSTGPTNTGSIIVDGVAKNWTMNYQIMGGATSVTGQIISADPSLQASFLSLGANNTETIQILRSALSGAFYNGGADMTPITVVDSVGNLSQAFNLNGDRNANTVLSGLAANLNGQISNAKTLATQAQNLVNNTNTLQQAQSGVDLNAEMAQAMQYQRAYEAAVRMQYVMDEMLNVLINQMGSTGSTNNTVI